MALVIFDAGDVRKVRAVDGTAGHDHVFSADVVFAVRSKLPDAFFVVPADVVNKSSPNGVRVEVPVLKKKRERRGRIGFVRKDVCTACAILTLAMRTQCWRISYPWIYLELGM